MLMASCRISRYFILNPPSLILTGKSSLGSPTGIFLLGDARNAAEMKPNSEMFCMQIMCSTFEIRPLPSSGRPSRGSALTRLILATLMLAFYPPRHCLQHAPRHAIRHFRVVWAQVWADGPNGSCLHDCGGQVSSSHCSAAAPAHLTP